MNWYSKQIYRYANNLIKSLGLESDSEDFANAQRYEKKLKEDGSWQKILQTKKQQGKDEAVKLFRNKINEYFVNVESNKPDINPKDYNRVEHVGKTSSGADWYEFRGEYFGNEEEVKNRYKHDIRDDTENVVLDALVTKDLLPRIQNKIKDIYRKEPSDLNAQNLKFYKSQHKKYVNEDNRSETEIRDLYDIMDTDDDFYDIYDEYMDIFIESKIKENEGLVDDAFNELIDVACGGGWCISQIGHPAAKDYVREGNSFLILRRNGEARVAIRFTDNNSYNIAEVQFPHNEGLSSNFLDYIDLMETPYISFSDLEDHNLEDHISFGPGESMLTEMFQLDESKAAFTIDQIISSGLMKLTIERTSLIDFLLNLYESNIDPNSKLYSHIMELIEERVDEDEQRSIRNLTLFYKIKGFSQDAFLMIKDLVKRINPKEINEYYFKYVNPENKLPNVNGDSEFIVAFQKLFSHILEKSLGTNEEGQSKWIEILKQESLTNAGTGMYPENINKKSKRSQYAYQVLKSKKYEGIEDLAVQIGYNLAYNIAYKVTNRINAYEDSEKLQKWLQRHIYRDYVPAIEYSYDKKSRRCCF